MRKKILFVIVPAILIVTAFGWLKLKPQNSPPAPAEKSTTSSAKSSAPTFDKSKHPLDKAGSIWWVVNKKRPLDPITYAPTDLANVGGQQIRQEAAKAFLEMQNEAKSLGLNLQPLSGYRSYATQDSVYKKEVSSFGQALRIPRALSLEPANIKRA